MDAIYDINGNAVKENDRIRFKSGKEGIVENCNGDFLVKFPTCEWSINLIFCSCFYGEFEIISDKRNCSGTSG